MDPQQVCDAADAAEARAQQARSDALDAAQAGDSAGVRRANEEARAAADEADTLRARLALMRAEFQEERRLEEVSRRNAARQRARELADARRAHAKRFDAAMEELSAAWRMLRENSRAVEQALAEAGTPHNGLSGSDVVNVVYAAWQDQELARALRLPHVPANHRTTMAQAAMRRVPVIADEEA